MLPDDQNVLRTNRKKNSKWRKVKINKNPSILKTQESSCKMEIYKTGFVPFVTPSNVSRLPEKNYFLVLLLTSRRTDVNYFVRREKNLTADW